MIYQDFSFSANLTVAENIAFSHELSQRQRLVRWKEVRGTAQQALDKVGVAVPLDADVEQLSVADKQVVAIARALVQGARLIAMDEPTTALTEREVQSLFTVVRRLKADGVAVIFISHKLPRCLPFASASLSCATAARWPTAPRRASMRRHCRTSCWTAAGTARRRSAPRSRRRTAARGVARPRRAL